jgi:transcriptional regulator with XRE-family HTH domain
MIGASRRPRRNEQGAPMPDRGLVPIRVPDGFWAREDVWDALGQRAAGRLFKLVRQHTGVSQSRLGAAVDLSQGTISQTIRGNRSIMSLDVLERIAAGLEMPTDARARFGLANADSSPVPARLTMHDVDLGTLAGILTGSSVDDRDLDFIERSSYELVRRYPTTGPASMWPMVAAQMTRLNNIVALRQRLSVHRRAVALIGILSGIAGNLWLDRGRAATASAYYGVGRVAGHETNDDSLTAWIITMESIAPFYARSTHYAASMLDQASQLADRSAGRRRKAWISALRARTYADIDADTALRSLADAYADLDQAEPASGMDFFDSARSSGIAGTVHLRIGDTATATLLMTSSLAQRPHDDAKGRALLTLDLAAARAKDQEPEAACQLVLDSLSIAQTQLVHPIVTRAREVVGGMARWRSSSAVRTVNERLRMLDRRPAAKE